MSSILDSIKGISLEKGNDLHVIMGKPGSGKTTLAGTYPKPMLVITVGNDGGAVVLQHYGDENVKTINLEKGDPKNPDKTHAGVALNGILDELLEDSKGFKTIVIDAYSSVQEDLVTYLEEAKGKQINQQEWGNVGTYMLKLRDKLVRLSRKDDISAVVPLVHIKTKEDTDTTTGEVGEQIIPKMTANNGRLLLERANTVVYCARKVVQHGEDKMVKFVTYVGAHPNIDTKLRTNGKVLIDSGFYIEDCSYDKLENVRVSGVSDGVGETKVIETTISKNEETDDGETW